MVENQGLYSISFRGLSLGSHVFDWTIDDKFFVLYEMSEISDAHINVQATLVKHASFLELNFVLEGWAEVNCDRCLYPVKLDITSDAQLFVKFGEHTDEAESEDNDIVVLSYDEDQLDVAQYLYEYAHLSLPIRRVHPNDADRRSTCNEEMIRKLEQYLVEDNSAPGSRWDELENFSEN